VKKLSMKVDELHVESFAVQAGKREIRGTVRANMDNSNMCWSINCWMGTDSGCYETMGCTFTADFDCMESANCP